MNTATYKNWILTGAVAALALFLLGFFAVARAETTSGASTEGDSAATSTSTQIRERLRQQEEDLRERSRAIQERLNTERENIRTMASTTREKIRQKVETAAAERFRAQVSMVVRRLNAAVERLLRLSDRLESRLNKLADKGIDVTEPRALLGIARTEIANAESVIGEMPEAVEAVLGSDTPRETFKKTRDIIDQAKASLKKAHRALVDAIVATKAAGGVKADEAATSTEAETDD